ncbi:MAG: glycoside hydrolase family 16 protein, partial [bacterium]
GCDQNLCNWGNDELQWYSASAAEVADGVLKIHATRADIGGKAFQSARLKTENIFFQKYGRFEARMKLPRGKGVWPAFWMMPQGKSQPWPIEGEIDILERGGRNDIDLRQISGAIHFGDKWPGNRYYSEALTVHYLWDEAFHNFRVDWEPQRIRWSVDGKVYGEARPEDIAPHSWPFDDKPFYLILNLAVGGNLGGRVPKDFEGATLEVDYVRAYTLCDSPQVLSTGMFGTSG